MPHIQLYRVGQTLSSTLSPKGEQVFKVLLQQSSLFFFLPSVLSISVLETLLKKPLCPMLLKCLNKCYCIQLSLSIIILIVIPSIPKVVSSFPNILFSITLTGQKINQAVIVAGYFVIYFICLASSIASNCVRFRDIHTSHLFLPHIVDPITLSNGYNLVLT